MAVNILGLEQSFTCVIIYHPPIKMCENFLFIWLQFQFKASPPNPSQVVSK